MRTLSIILLLVMFRSTSTGQLAIGSTGRFVEVNHAKIYFEEYGQGEPLFLLHGFLSTAEDWRNFINEYSKKYRVLVWDMRGHGRSSNPDELKDFKHEQAALDLLELMKILGINKAKAIGHSSGAITILYASTMAPEKFDAIVLVSSQNYFSQPVRDWLKSRIWENYFDQTELDSLHGREKSLNLKNQFYQFSFLKGDPSISNDRLKKIKARTLVVHGDNDFIPVSQAWEIYKNIPGARIWISPNTGHMPQYGAGNENDFILRTLDFLHGEGWDH